MVQALWLCSFTLLLQYILFFISMGNTHSTYNMLRFSQQCLIHNKPQAAYVAFFRSCKNNRNIHFLTISPLRNGEDARTTPRKTITVA